MDDLKTEFCDTTVIHEDILNKVRGSMPKDEPVYDVSELFRVLGDSTRARIICALTISEMCVCDISSLLGMTSSAISHQLRILKQTSILRSRRKGKVVYYRLADEHIAQLFKLAFDHVTEEQGAAE